MDNPLLVVTFATALSSGLVAGVFFAFSTFIMRALARLPAPQGIAAMQSINVVVITPLFMLALFGTGIVCLLLAGYSFFREPPLAGRIYLVAGGMIYFVSNVVVTIAFNVPKNNALAAVNPATAEGARVWADYLMTWSAWNHVRTVGALAAAALLTTAIVR